MIGRFLGAFPTSCELHVFENPWGERAGAGQHHALILSQSGAGGQLTWESGNDTVITWIPRSNDGDATTHGFPASLNALDSFAPARLAGHGRT